MKSGIAKTTFLVGLSIFLIGSAAWAGGKSKTSPTGWKQGEKTGWKGEEVPPGLDEKKLEKKHKGKMKKGTPEEAAERQSQKEKAKKDPQKQRERYESELEAEKEKRESDLETEKEKIKARTKKNES